jgi:DNA-binding PadR family transcriptional regulator
MSETYLARAEKCFSFISVIIELSKGKKISGYDIVRHLRKFEFNISPGTTYHQLEMLSRDGIIKEEKKQWGKTYKTVYTLTLKGEKLFKDFKGKWKKPLEYAARNLK